MAEFPVALAAALEREAEAISAARVADCPDTRALAESVALDASIEIVRLELACGIL